MARFSRLHPVKSQKHIVDKQGGLLAGTQVVDVLAVVVDDPVVSNPGNLHIASTVNAIFLNVQVSTTSTAALANVYMYVMKNPGANLANPQANSVGQSDEKRFVIHQEMIMLERATLGIPRTLFKGVIKIPRGYKRFGIKDRLQIALLSPGVNMDYCHQVIYKEFN